MTDSNLGRRKFHRLKAKLQVYYRVVLAEGEYSGFDYVFTKDISSGGLLIMSEQQFPQGTPIEMSIRLPSYPAKKITVSGEVTSNESAGPGKLLFRTRVKFMDLQSDGHKELDAFIAQSMKNNNYDNPAG